MNRLNFFKEEIVDGVKELDFLYNNLNKLELKRRSSQYRVTQSDLSRPDLISYRFYNTVRYWWVIMSVNNIFNPLIDISVGDVLTIPNLLDIYDFNKKYRIR